MEQLTPHEIRLLVELTNDRVGMWYDKAASALTEQRKVYCELCAEDASKLEQKLQLLIARKQ